MNRRLAAFALSLAAVLALAAGCAAPTPRSPARAPGHALDAPDTGDLRILTDMVAGSRPAGRSRLHAIPSNRDALMLRLALIDSAVSSLDLQYYLWSADAAGDLLVRRLLAAADRGVRVRALIDDFLLPGDGRDSAVLSEHKNIEVRVYNPWRSGRSGVATRGIEWLARSELNHRMHNKLLAADNRVAIVGGRNIANEYFGLDDDLNFKDLDLLVAGPAVPALSETFDDFWNDEWAYPVEEVAPTPSDRDRQKLYSVLEPTPEQVARLAAFPLEPKSWRAELLVLAGELRMGDALAVSDDPRSLRESVPDQVFDSLNRLTLEIERELVVVSAYFVPDAAMIEYFRELTDEGIRVCVLTNSLASNNHPIASSQYKRHRGALLDAGVELYEMRHDPDHRDETDTPPVTASAHVLHTKAIVVDRERAFVGALNISPRGVELNSENGVLVLDSPLVEELAERFDADLAPGNAWRVFRDHEGRIRWESSAGLLSRQPARTTSQRFQDWLFGLFSLESQI